jgi:BirA family biotin operon repressor/biotin-[acetyl-CoA-carboxylase] ligase
VKRRRGCKVGSHDGAVVITFEVRHYASIGSTNDEARRLAAEGAPHGTVVHADQQTTGRGRLARRWVSPPGNLYLSVVLRLHLPMERSGEIGFVAALAVADAVDAMLPSQVRTALKWPNDVLVRGGKISGILLERAEEALILGIGINVLLAPAGMPYLVSTIVGCGGLATVDGMRTKLLAELANWLEVWEQDGFVPIRAAWLLRAHPVGTPLRLTIGERVVGGSFAGLADDGALILHTERGRERFVVGDVGFG